MAAVGSGEPREPKTVAKEEINATLGVSYNSPVLYTPPPRIHDSNNIRQPHSVAKEKHEEQGNKKRDSSFTFTHFYHPMDADKWWDSPVNHCTPNKPWG